MADTLTQLKYNDDIEYVYTDTFDSTELKCIEIEPDMLEDLHCGKLEIRGDLDDETVLVTSHNSYRMRQADSSNTILLTSFHNANRINNDEMNDDVYMHTNEDIYATISCVYILDPVAPKLNTLHDILYQRPYKGVLTQESSPEIDDYKAIEHDNKNKKKIDLSFDGLKQLVQCSDKELMEALEEINAIEIHNEWRIIDEEYLASCFKDMLLCVMEHLIDFRKFRNIEIIQNMNEFPTEIIDHCIKIHCVSRKEDENGYWRFDEKKVCLFCAKYILRENGHKMKDSKLKQEWSLALPYGLVPNEEMLKGHLIAMYEKKVHENVWYIFEEQELSLDAKTRFKQLFERKDEWDMDAIKPYLLSLVKARQSVDKLLLRHSRMVRRKDSNGKEKRTYISRNAKRSR